MILAETQEQLRDMVRAYTQEQIRPCAAGH